MRFVRMTHHFSDGSNANTGSRRSEDGKGTTGPEEEWGRTYRGRVGKERVGDDLRGSRSRTTSRSELVQTDSDLTTRHRPETPLNVVGSEWYGSSLRQESYSGKYTVVN